MFDFSVHFSIGMSITLFPVFWHFVAPADVKAAAEPVATMPHCGPVYCGEQKSEIGMVHLVTLLPNSLSRAKRSMVMVMPRPLVRVIGGLDEASETVVIRDSNPEQQSCLHTRAHHLCHRSTAYSTSKSQQKVW